MNQTGPWFFKVQIKRPSNRCRMQDAYRHLLLDHHQLGVRIRVHSKLGLLIEGQLIFAWKGTVSVPRGQNCSVLIWNFIFFSQNFIHNNCLALMRNFKQEFLHLSFLFILFFSTYLLTLIRENDKRKTISTITWQQSIFVLHSQKPKQKHPKNLLCMEPQTN